MRKLDKLHEDFIEAQQALDVLIEANLSVFEKAASLVDKVAAAREEVKRYLKEHGSAGEGIGGFSVTKTTTKETYDIKMLPIEILREEGVISRVNNKAILDLMKTRRFAELAPDVARALIVEESTPSVSAPKVIDPKGFRAVVFPEDQ